MPLFNDDTPITPGLDVSNSEGSLIYGSDENGIAKQIKTNLDGNILTEEPKDYSQSFNPDPANHITGTVPRNRIDVAGNLAIRGQSFSDEGSLRDDFVGSSLFTNLTGTVSVTNGSVSVTGSGTAFLSELTIQNYIKITTESESVLAKISSVESDTALTLEETYTGSTTSATAHKTLWKTSTPAGGSISVGSSEVSLAIGTSSGVNIQFFTTGDYLPYTLSFRARITQRITNQTIKIGFISDTTVSSPEIQACIVFDGTDETQVKFRTSSSSNANDIEETLVTLPNGLLTSSKIRYEIDISSTTALLIINGSIVARHIDHIPGPYDVLNIGLRGENAAAVTATTFAIDSLMFFNVDQTQITNSFRGDPISVSNPSVEGTGSLAPYSASLNGLKDLSGNIRAFTGDNAGSQYVSFQENTTTGTLGSLNAEIKLALSGSTSAGFQLAAGTLVGTLTAEMSYDSGTTWVPIGFFDVDTKGLQDTIVFSSANTAQTKVLVVAPGGGLARVRVSAYTSGTTTGTIRTSIIPQIIVYNSPLDGRRTTYSAATAVFTPAATATDIFTITGSSTKIIRVLNIIISATITTAASNNIFLIKRSTANTGGTFVAATKVPHDSQSAAATATVQHYTANPTVLGTTVGNVRTRRGIIPASATAVSNPIVVWEFGTRPAQGIVLRGTGEQLVVNLNSVTFTGGSISISVEWTEE